jgi:hypothetical protein
MVVHLHLQYRICIFVNRCYCRYSVLIEGNELNFTFCWPCISIYACNQTNLIPQHVSGLILTNHQEVAMYVCNNWYVLYVLVDRPADSQLNRTTHTNWHIYTGWRVTDWHISQYISKLRVHKPTFGNRKWLSNYEHFHKTGKITFATFTLVRALHKWRGISRLHYEVCEMCQSAPRHSEHC